jgi:ribose 5-phosphate isomerase A
MSKATIESLKRDAGVAAAAEVKSGMRVGLGTGSTVRYTIENIGERIRSGALQDIVGVPTSIASDKLARECGIPLSNLDETPRLHLTIDGADEVDPKLDLIKGLGAALLREKIVAAASDRLIIVADDGKLVEKLGTKAPLPVAVLPFGWTAQMDFLRELGAEPERRLVKDESVLVTDDGLFLLDSRFANGIDDAPAIERALALRPGIVECGLFLGMADAAYIAAPTGVEVLRRPESG